MRYPMRTWFTPTLELCHMLRDILQAHNPATAVQGAYNTLTVQGTVVKKHGKQCCRSRMDLAIRNGCVLLKR